ncbi:alpha/beta hydrolase [Acetobacter sp. TBRC 12305]|uniref:Alpha/beta hydrolase n=1 Tax=Acetobacter garciniae TaxID=2817435 RepID=A0A939HMU7_9PROT|nr:alpha/beta hydrolase [Acetobacter garciniae]MBO1325071.1 alpha/beta hydrolase [Acetobacter garciniae]MBX0344958.1 alpha/beta hydrolase [Acetobacter garciniae]
MEHFTRHEADICGVRTVWLTAGSGPPLIFLHGVGTFPGFNALLPLARNRTLIIPYHPNFGDSGSQKRIATINDYVLFYLDYLDHLGVQHCDLAGLSLGGWLAAEIAIRQPARLRRLVLAAPAGLVVSDCPAPALTSIPPPDLPAYLTFNPAVAGSFFPSTPDPVFTTRLEREVSAYLRLTSDCVQGNPQLDYWCHRITCPTLLLWGEQDRIRPVGQANAWQNLLRDATLVRLPRTGHLLFEEQTQIATETVTIFLN